jgi:methylthioribose-1-phosphate isomerase
MHPYRAIQWVTGPDGQPAVRMLDQRLIPQQEAYLGFTDYQEVAAAIREMVIRGAPAIGLAAAYGMALAACYAPLSLPEMHATLASAADTLCASRPTAVNLSWAVERMMQRLADPSLATVEALREAAVAEAQAIDAENLQMDLDTARHAFPLVPERANIYHHCNTGPLATGGYGSALGVVRYAHEQGKQVHVFVDETRPRLQGARLTAWELQRMGVPFTVVPDGASGHIMRTRRIDLCVVGCDRVAANGDTANKIGTYNLALAARAHGVPFYVVGPTSTVDLATPSGDDIPIEERPDEEVSQIAGVPITPAGASVANPAFDVTPASFITAIITQAGVASPPFVESLAKLVTGYRRNGEA